jgi:hypothetical protein
MKIIKSENPWYTTIDSVAHWIQNYETYNPSDDHIMVFYNIFGLYMHESAKHNVMKSVQTGKGGRTFCRILPYYTNSNTMPNLLICYEIRAVIKRCL